MRYWGLRLIVWVLFYGLYSQAVQAERLPIVTGKVIEANDSRVVVHLNDSGNVLQSVDVSEISVFAIRNNRLRELEKGLFWSTLVGAGVGLGASVIANGRDPRELTKHKRSTGEKVALGAGIAFVARSAFNFFCNKHFVVVFDENELHRNSPTLLKSHLALLAKGSEVRIRLK